MDNEQTLEYKVVMIGAIAVGKTSITDRLQFQVFEEGYQPTIGAGFIPYKTTCNGKKVELQIWDTAGMERYKSLGSIYYRDSKAAVLVFDQTSQESANALDKWLDNFRETITVPCPIFVAANKDDLPNKVVNMDNMREWCNAHKFPLYITSAKTGLGVHKMFEDLIQTIMNENLKNQPETLQLRKLKKKDGCC